MKFGILFALLPTASLLAGCSADVADETSPDESSGAVVAGGNDVSPLEDGIYDGVDQSFAVFAAPGTANAQGIAILDGWILCHALVDVNVGSGALRMVPPKDLNKGPACAGRLRNIMSGRAFDLLDIVRGEGQTVQTGRFTRRADDALVGVYAGGSLQIRIQRSTDKRIDFELEVAGAAPITDHAEVDPAPYLETFVNDRAAFRILRSNGRFEIAFDPGSLADQGIKSTVLTAR